MEEKEQGEERRKGKEKKKIRKRRGWFSLSLSLDLTL
jgi:hypothetical protein